MASSASPRATSSPASATMAPSMVGLELERPAQRLLGPSRIALGHQDVGLGRRRGQLGHELGHRRLGLRADEPVDHLAVLQGEHGRDRLHLEAARDGRVLVDVDLGQGHRPLGGVDHLLDDRSEGPARTAPRGPQVHHHGDLGGPAEDLLFERGIGDVDHDRRRYREHRSSDRHGAVRGCPHRQVRAWPEVEPSAGSVVGMEAGSPTAEVEVEGIDRDRVTGWMTATVRRGQGPRSPSS